MKKCSKCSKLQSIDSFYRDSTTKSGYRCYCKTCAKIMQQNYRKKHPEYSKNTSKKFREKHPSYHTNWYSLHPEKSKERSKRIYRENPELCKQAHYKWVLKNKESLKQYNQKRRKEGKLRAIEARHAAKRKRNLGWIKLFENPFSENEEIEWHHINNTFVVAIPKDLHRLYLTKNHRDNTLEIIKQIYSGSR